MKFKVVIFCLGLLLMMSSCLDNRVSDSGETSIQGTWKLMSAVTIVGEDTSRVHYSTSVEGIKMLNKTHFSFFQHDLTKGADSTKVFVSGAGRYTLQGDRYTEVLEYCSAREWENHTFDFTISLKGDTLLQTGIEKLPELHVDRVIIETYIRLPAEKSRM